MCQNSVKYSGMMLTKNMLLCSIKKANVKLRKLGVSQKYLIIKLFEKKKINAID